MSPSRLDFLYQSIYLLKDLTLKLEYHALRSEKLDKEYMDYESARYELKVITKMLTEALKDEIN